MNTLYRISFRVVGAEFRSYEFNIPTGHDDDNTIDLMAKGQLFEHGWSQQDNLSYDIEYFHDGIWHNINGG